MIHEDLLNRIAQAGLEPYGNVMPTHLVLALCAVVKLHTGKGISNRCVSCYNGNKCETIQVIEEELGLIGRGQVRI
jgi:hypothetical protein